jgi:glyoxylase I family protein
VTIAVRGLCPLLQVFDMPTSLLFYRDILGFVEVAKSGLGDEVGWTWLRHGDGAELMLNTAYDEGQRPPAADPTRQEVHGDTILYLGCEDLDGAYAFLVGKGVRAEPPKMAPYGMKQLHLYDPDGYGLCFQWRGVEGQAKAD